MSDPNYPPYGVDDDPFLTHPAGIGRAPLRADRRYGAPVSGQRVPQYAAPPAPARMPPAPPPQAYDAQGYARPAGQYAPADQGQWGAQTAYADAPNYPAHPSQHQYDAPRQAHFSAHQGYDAGYDDHRHAAEYGAEYGAAAQGFAPDRAAPPAYHDPRPQPRPEPHPEMRAEMRAEPRLSAPPRHAMPAASHGSHAAAPRQAASFAAPPRHVGSAPAHPAHAQSHAPAARAPLAHPAYGQGYHAQPSAPYPPREYAPLPQQASGYAPADDGGYSLDFLPSAAKLSQWAGAICTVLAVVGAGYWGYALAVRDAHGIPVVRAQVDPLRIAPETPGGEISANQGLAVNSIPAAAAPTIPDQITLAPQVAELAPEDTQIIESGSFAKSGGAGTAEALAGASDKVLTAPETKPETTGGLSADLTALPDSLPEDMPMSDAEAVERALEAALAEGGDPMPQETAEAALAPAEPASMSATDPIAPPTSELDPASIAVGTPLAQLGAFDTPETARAEWANLQTRFTELMAGKSLVVEPAKSGGRDFFRLRAHGFASADDTRRFCAAILAENGSCFPVDQR